MKDLWGYMTRACLVCCLIKTGKAFEMNGCDNCDEFLQLKNNKRKVYKCTSRNFQGLIVIEPFEVNTECKYQGIPSFCKGLYAEIVEGRLPHRVAIELSKCGITLKTEHQL